MLNRTWKLRFKRIQEQVTYLAASTAHTELMRKIPATRDNKAYRESLELVGISGMPKGTSGFAIHASAKRKKVQELDAGLVLVDVRPRGRLRRVSPELKVLITYSPWTLDTLPFMPSKTQASVVYRKVSAAEVIATNKLRVKDLPKVRRKLGRAGEDTQRQAKRSSPGTKIAPDLAFGALRTEFGQGPDRPKPHWRPALGVLKRSGLPGLARNKELQRAATDPDFKGWMSWPKKTSRRISVKVAKTFEGFQKKLNVKF
jgi:hypothetical protein